MSDIMDQCINPDQSLAELYRLQASYKRSLKMGKLLNREKIVLTAIKDSLTEVNDKIKRVEDLNNDQWGYIGITVEITVHIDNTLSDTVFDSLWGIESDSGTECFVEMINELKESVKDQLTRMGFSTDEINASVDNSILKKGECRL